MEVDIFWRQRRVDFGGRSILIHRDAEHRRMSDVMNLNLNNKVCSFLHVLPANAFPK